MIQLGVRNQTIMTEKPNPAASFTALALYGAAISGMAGMLAGLLALVSGEWVSAGVGFGLAGITFGLIANALVRR